MQCCCQVRIKSKRSQNIFFSNSYQNAFIKKCIVYSCCMKKYRPKYHSKKIQISTFDSAP